MLTDAQVQKVQTSFALIVPRANAFSILFYDRLFEIAPDVRHLFGEDMTAQRGKLVTTLATVVQSLHQLEQVLPEVHALGVRHNGYAVKTEHYDPVGAALLWTIEQSLGSEWSPELAEAWTNAYTALAGEMIKAAKAAAAA